MYFIARNNKVYSYIAHTKPAYRYYGTLAFVFLMVCCAFYTIQYPLNAYLLAYAQQYGALEQKYKTLKQLEHKTSKLADVVTETKNDLLNSVVSGSSDDFFKKQLLFILDAAQSAGLKISSYGGQKEKDGKWYTKEIAHFDVTGSLKQIMNFLETLKNAQKMITFSQWSLVCVSDNTFQMHCDLGFVFILNV